MAGWMKTPLGAEVDLGSGHIVLDGDPAPPVKGAQQPPPSFWPWLPISATAELLFENIFTVTTPKHPQIDQLYAYARK